MTSSIYAKYYEASTINGIAIETWYQAGYIDPSDLTAVKMLEVVPDGIIRPYLLKIDGNQQAFATEDQRTKYLDWRIGLAERKAAK